MYIEKSTSLKSHLEIYGTRVGEALITRTCPRSTEHVRGGVNGVRHRRDATTTSL